MSLEALTKKAQTKAPETSSGDRIEIIEVADTDPNHALVALHFQGKALKKEGEAMFGKARRLYQQVVAKLLSNRASDRPKQFKFTANVGGTEHTTTVNVREHGYSTFDDSTLDKVKGITGDQFVDAHITRNISAKVDFSLVPTDKQDAIAEHLMQINTMLGVDVVEVDVLNRVQSSFHEARTSLTEDQDIALNKLVPVTCSFGR